MSRLNATVNANSTISDGHITHVGQMFFDQDLITLADTVEPYASNDQGLTLNSDDSILAEEAADVDPFVEYVLLGDDISEGLFGWLAFGMDSTNAYNITPAAYWTDEGGVENENSGGMGGGPPSGAGPSGAMPTGAMTSGATVESSTSTAVASSLSVAVASSAASSFASETTPSALGVVLPSNAPQGGRGRGKGQQPQPNDEGQQPQHKAQARGHY
jgi:uncharacterized low-complexity protein